MKGPDKISDEMFILADVAMKLRRQVAVFVAEVLSKHLEKEKAQQLVVILSESRWTHDFPITREATRELGLPVDTNMPQAVYDLMDLYSQGGGMRPSVFYAPLPRAPGHSPVTGGERPPAAPAN